MSFKKKLKLIFFISVIFYSNISANTILGGQYKLDITVQDPDEKYPVSIKLDFSDNSKLNSAKFIYPTYDCDSVLKESTTNKNQITIFETMNQNKCENTSYIFHLSKSGFSKIEKIYNIYQNQQIPTAINKTNFKPTKLSQLRIKYNILKWEDIDRLTIDITSNPSKNKFQDYIYIYQKFSTQKKKKEIKEQVFIMAKEINSIKMYDIYLDIFPQNIYKKEIFSLKEKIVFAQIRQNNTIKSYKSYLNKYPKGEFTKEAKLQIYNINKAEKKRKEKLKNERLARKLLRKMEQEKILSSTPTQTFTIESSLSPNSDENQDIYIPKNTDITYITLNNYSQNLEINLYEQDCQTSIGESVQNNPNSKQFFLKNYNGKKLCAQIKNPNNQEISYSLHTQNLNTFYMFQAMFATRILEDLLFKGAQSLLNTNNTKFEKSTRIANNILLSKLLGRSTKKIARSVIIHELKAEMRNEFGIDFLGLIMGDLYVEILEEAYRFR